MVKKKKSLIETNPYLRDPAERKAGLIRFVVSSSAIEGIQVELDNEMFDSALTPKSVPLQTLNSKKSHP
jgi:hypothetical protein